MTHVALEEAYVGMEEQQVDVYERATVTTLMESTCVCKIGIGSKPCSSQFSTDHLMLVQASCFELTRSEQINQRHNTWRRIVREWPAVFTTRGNRSERICSGFFTLSVKPTTRTWRRGLATRSHGNTKRKPAHSPSFFQEAVTNDTKSKILFAKTINFISPGKLPHWQVGRSRKESQRRDKFDMHGLGEMGMYLHADNCTSQNVVVN